MYVKNISSNRVDLVRTSSIPEYGSNNNTHTLNLLAYDVGDLVLIHGSVLHKSECNRSPYTRFAYTFHMVESPPFAVYDGKNWLQPTAEMPFSSVLDVPVGLTA